MYRGASSALKLAILSDIWGIDQALTRWSQSITDEFDVVLLSPYMHLAISEPQHFANDDQAYDFFIKNGGLARYTADARQWLLDQQSKVICIGFSAGAAVAYQLACDTTHPQAVFGIYGGQIHRLQALSQTVQCPVQLIFSDEPHFDVPELVHLLSQQPHVDACHWPYSHGFANHRSAGFNPEALLKLTDTLKAWLRVQNNHV